jgi:hypothetical protein
MVTGISDADNGVGIVPVVDKDQTSNLMNCFHDLTPMLIFNVAKCSMEERSRLFARRLGYCDSNSLVRMCKDPDFGELPEFCQLN